MSRRTERIANVIRRVIAGELQRGLADPRFHPLSSITRVEVTDDLGLARVHVSVMDDLEQRRRLGVEALNSAAGRLRGVVRDNLATRQIPRIEFRLDEGLRRGLETVAVIEATRAADAAQRAAAGRPVDPGPEAGLSADAEETPPEAESPSADDREGPNP